MKMLSLALGLSLSALAVGVAGEASAQYLTPGAQPPPQQEPGYFPENRRSTNLSLAGSESGFYTQGRVPSRIGFAVDFGAGGLTNRKLDDRFYSPNGTPELGGIMAFAWNTTLYGQFMDSFRVGMNIGGITGGQRDVDARLLNVGLLVEGGSRFYTGWGLWLGASLGYGRGLASSADYANSDVSYYDYESRGLGVRGFGRIERELAPFITLRLTPFVDTVIRTDDRYTTNLPAGESAMIPDRSKGTFLSYGVMLGIALHSF